MYATAALKPGYAATLRKYSKLKPDDRQTVLTELFGHGSHHRLQKRDKKPQFQKGDFVLEFYHHGQLGGGFYFETVVNEFLNMQVYPGYGQVPFYSTMWSEGWAKLEQREEKVLEWDLMATEKQVLPMEVLTAHYWNVWKTKQLGKSVEDAELKAYGLFSLTKEELKYYEQRFVSPLPGFKNCKELLGITDL